MTEPAKTPLTGKALLNRIKELSHLSPREKARYCGYYTGTKDDRVRINFTGFQEAILAANGILLSPESGKDGRGREPTYRVSVHQNGQIVIGSTYTKEMGLKPGDEFVIKLGYKHIRLIQLGEGKDGDGSEFGADEADDE
jgi:AbrB-like transcriptional regulator